MTETQEPTLVAVDEPRPTSTQSASGPTGRGTGRRKDGSLSSMLLPELQSLAGTLGINSAKLRKSDLIAAIEAQRSGSAPAAAPEAVNGASPRRERRAANRPAGAPSSERAADGRAVDASTAPLATPTNSEPAPAPRIEADAAPVLDRAGTAEGPAASTDGQDRGAGQRAAQPAADRQPSSDRDDDYDVLAAAGDADTATVVVATETVSAVPR